jgi:hypothetical protein
MKKQTLIMFLIAHYEYGLESIEGMGYEEACYFLSEQNLFCGSYHATECEFGIIAERKCVDIYIQMGFIG